MRVEVLLVPGRGVGTGRASRAWYPVPTAIFALDGLERGRREDRCTDRVAARGLPGDVEALGHVGQLREVTTELVCAAVLEEAVCVLGRSVWELSASCYEKGDEGVLQSKPSNRAKCILGVRILVIAGCRLSLWVLLDLLDLLLWLVFWNTISCCSRDWRGRNIPSIALLALRFRLLRGGILNARSSRTGC
jgi:hypothetical protein